MDTTYTYDRASILDAARQMAARMLSGESLASCVQYREQPAQGAALELWNIFAAEALGGSAYDVYPKTLGRDQRDEFREAVLVEMSRRIVDARG